MSPVAIRASSWSELFDCAARWAAKNIDGVWSPPSVPSVIGTAIHAGTAAFDESSIRGCRISIADAADIAADALLASNQVSWTTADTSRREAEAIVISQTMEYCRAFAHYKWVAVELTCAPLAVDVDGVEIVLTGSLDRLRLFDDESIGIVDLKSGARRIDSDGIVDVVSDGPQLGAYEVLAENELGTTIDGGFIANPVYFFRNVDRSTMKRLAQQEIEQIEELEGVPVSDESRKQIENAMWNKLAPFSPIEEHHATVIHHYASGITLFSGSTTAVQRAEHTIFSLFSVCGASRVHGKGLSESVSRLLKDHIHGVKKITHFDLTGSVTIKEKGSNAGSLTIKDLSIPFGRDSHGIGSLLDYSDAKVEKIGMNYRDLYTFTLKPKFEFASVRPFVDDDSLSDDQEKDPGQLTLENPVDVYCSEAAVTVELYVDMILALLEMLGIDKPEKPEMAILKTKDEAEE